MSNTKMHNFSAGPAILPQPVFKAASQACINYGNTGLSLLEMSHRGKEFSDIMARAIQNVHDLTGLGDDYSVLFLSGGASTQFFMIPMNILPSTGTAGYINSGRWADNAIKESNAFGNSTVLGSSKEDNFDHIPKGYTIPDSLSYLHITSNNTVAGSQFHNYPETGVPLICDMSSDLFSRPIDYSQFDLIYAGAQKNLGPAGTTLVIIKKSLLKEIDRHIPTMLDYNTHINKGSMFNTPPVFPIYVSMLTMDWIKENSGLEAMGEHNKKKAELVYNEIDRNNLFYGHVKPEDRSLMNITFNMHNNDLVGEFLAHAADMNCLGLKGHRSIGGLRASMYNALSIESAQTLVNAMQSFEKMKG